MELKEKRVVRAELAAALTVPLLLICLFDLLKNNRQVMDVWVVPIWVLL